MNHRVEAWLRVPLVLVEGHWVVDEKRGPVPQEPPTCTAGRLGGVHGRDCQAVLGLPPLPRAVKVGKTYVKKD